MRFTDKGISALRPKPQRYELWEDGGLGIRVTPRGGKSWTWCYHHSRRPRRMTFGPYPAVGLADARAKLAEARKVLGTGIDPGERQVESNQAERSAETVADLVELYLEKWARPRKRSAAEDERILRKDVIPQWGRRKAKEITRKNVVALLDGITERGAPIAANRTLAVIRRMFGLALSRDIISASPCAAVKAPSQENRRDRVLSADEIAALWLALDDPALGMSPEIRLALKFMLATAQRRGEVIGADWTEFDRTGDKVWTIPGSKAKNGMPHRVPLSSLSLALLNEIEACNKATCRKPPTRQDGSIDAAGQGSGLRWLFPSRSSEGPITGQAVDHAMRRGRSVTGAGDATPHDLRRTAASHMTSMGISRLVVSKILNHAEPGVTAVYDRHSYDAEKRAALAAWGTRLLEIVGAAPEATNVVSLSR
jgi:integrase